MTTYGDAHDLQPSFLPPPTQREATLKFWCLSLAWKGVEPYYHGYSSGRYLTELADLRDLPIRLEVSKQADTLSYEVVKGRHRRKAEKKRNNVTKLKLPQIAGQSINAMEVA